MYNVADASTNLGGGPLCVGLTVIVSAGLVALGVDPLRRSLRAPAAAIDRPAAEGGLGDLAGHRDRASASQLRRVRRDLAEEERLPGYSQVVDNDTDGRFAPRAGRRRTDGLAHGEAVRHLSVPRAARTRASGSRYPTSNDYTVYAWWPASSGGSSTPPASAWRSFGHAVDHGRPDHGRRRLDDARDLRDEEGRAQSSISAGGLCWVRRHRGGRGGRVRGDVTTPPGGARRQCRRAAGKRPTGAAARRGPNGRDVVRAAKRYMGTKYRWGTCTRSRMSCTCDTKKTYSGGFGTG